MKSVNRPGGSSYVLFISALLLLSALRLDTMFITKMAEDPEVLRRKKAILTDRLEAFLKVCIELRATEPKVLSTLMQDYRYSAAIVAPNLEATAPAPG